jgi:hypothetical protein
VPSAFAAPWEQLVDAPEALQPVLAAAPPLVEVDVAEPPIAVLLAQQALPVAPALADVDVELPPMAVLLAQQALVAALPGHALCVDVPTAAFSDFTLLVAASDCADTWLEIINPPIIRPQIIKILEIVFITSCINKVIYATTP